MKKIIGIILLLISIGGLIATFAVDLKTAYWCVCDLEGWRLGSGFKALIEMNLRANCLANTGCAPSYKLFPVDFLIISLGLGAAGIILAVNKKNKLDNI